MLGVSFVKVSTWPLFTRKVELLLEAHIILLRCFDKKFLWWPWPSFLREENQWVIVKNFLSTGTFPWSRELFIQIKINPANESFIQGKVELLVQVRIFCSNALKKFFFVNLSSFGKKISTLSPKSSCQAYSLFQNSKLSKFALHKNMSKLQTLFYCFFFLLNWCHN
jgi:hypothetical protein